MMDKETLRRLTAPFGAVVPQCSRCKRWLGLNKHRIATCQAYPDGIPMALIREQVNHFQENYPGDNGMLGILENE